MFAMIINETGGPEVLQYGEIATPEPGPGEVLIDVTCVGLNFFDTLIISWTILTPF